MVSILAVVTPAVTFAILLAMDTDLDRLFKYITLGVAAVATVFFVILGISQGEFFLSLLWAALASLILWILLLIVKRIATLIQSKLGNAKFRTEVAENEGE